MYILAFLVVLGLYITVLSVDTFRRMDCIDFDLVLEGDSIGRIDIQVEASSCGLDHLWPIGPIGVFLKDSRRLLRGIHEKMCLIVVYLGIYHFVA